jgi:hypothetical protein
MYRWLVRLALISGFLGLAGSIYIIREIYESDNSTVTLNQANSRITVGEESFIVRSEVSNASTAPDTSSNSKDTLETQLPETAGKVIEEDTTAPFVTPTVSDSLRLPALKQEKLQTPPKKKSAKSTLLTRKELEKIGGSIRKVRAKNKRLNACVQILTVKGSNNGKVAIQVERFLRSRKFTIAGRETTDKTIKGIQLRPNGGCIKLTIGIL